MHIHKNYFHDKTVLGLMTLNAAMLLIGVLSIVLRVDSSKGETFLVQWRSNLGTLGFKTGPISEIQSFVLFFILVVSASFILSIRLYGHRRHVATMLLGMTPFLILLGIIVSDRLIVHS